ncbi:MAG: MauE/DoxX family redox-associated membrane protein [Saprospiraceae bacterium]
MANKGWFVVKIILALFITYAGVQHFTNPDFFLKVIPPFLMKFGYPIVYISGIIEILIGLLMLTNKYQRIGALSFMWLMLFFLPLHIWDVFAENPFTGSQQNALIRLVMQFVLIGLPWKLQQFYSANQ